MSNDGSDAVFGCFVLIVIILGAGIYGLFVMNKPIEGEVDEKAEGVIYFRFRIGNDWYKCTSDEYEEIQCQDIVKFNRPTVFHWRVRNLEIIKKAD